MTYFVYFYRGRKVNGDRSRKDKQRGTNKGEIAERNRTTRRRENDPEEFPI